MFKIPSNQNQVRFPEEQEVLEAEVSRFEPKGRGTREIETSLEWLAWRRVPRSTPTRSASKRHSAAPTDFSRVLPGPEAFYSSQKIDRRFL